MRISYRGGGFWLGLIQAFSLYLNKYLTNTCRFTRRAQWIRVMPHESSRHSAASDDTNEGPEALRRMENLAPYKQGKMAIPGRESVIKLSSNESCFGPSPRAIEAYHAAAAR